jgi:hypothetical protein
VLLGVAPRVPPRRRSATPIPFRDLLLGIAATAGRLEAAG